MLRKWLAGLPSKTLFKQKSTNSRQQVSKISGKTKTNRSKKFTVLFLPCLKISRKGKKTVVRRAVMAVSCYMAYKSATKRSTNS